MKTNIKKENDATIFSLSGRLDSNSAPLFEIELQSFLACPGCNLVFDFNDLDYISSAGLRIILKTARLLKEKNGAFALCQANEQILEVLEISGFLEIIDYYSSSQEAVAAIAG